MSKHTLTVRISKDVHDRAKEISVRDKRSMSFIVDKAVNDYVNRQKQNDAFVIKVG